MVESNGETLVGEVGDEPWVDAVGAWEHSDAVAERETRGDEGAN